MPEGLFDDEGSFTHRPRPSSRRRPMLLSEKHVEEVLRRAIRGVARRLGSDPLDDNDREEPTALGMLDG